MAKTNLIDEVEDYLPDATLIPTAWDWDALLADYYDDSIPDYDYL